MSIFDDTNQIVNDFFNSCNKIILHKNKAIATVFYKDGKAIVKPNELEMQERFTYLQNSKKDKDYYRVLRKQKASMINCLQWELI